MPSLDTTLDSDLIQTHGQCRQIPKTMRSARRSAKARQIYRNAVELT
jgi:hypothetical protein